MSAKCTIVGQIAVPFTLSKVDDAIGIEKAMVTASNSSYACDIEVSLYMVLLGHSTVFVAFISLLNNISPKLLTVREEKLHTSCLSFPARASGFKDSAC